MMYNIFEMIKDRANIKDICFHYGVNLDSNNKALCPFPEHTEKTASFSILPKKNIFCCFGCGKKGDVINLVRYLEGCSAIEAAKKINNICHCGIDLLEDKSKPSFEVDKQYALYKQKAMEERKKKQEMEEIYQTLYIKACEVYQKWYKLYQKTKTWDIDEEGLSDIYKNECYFDGIIDILNNYTLEEVYNERNELFEILERGII